MFEIKIVKNNLFRCLKKKRFNLNISLLSNMKKKLRIMNDDIDEWIKTLIIEFRKQSIKIMKLFFIKKYTMIDATKNKLLKKYAQFVIKFDNSIELSTYNQLLQIWNEFNANFQLHVTKLIAFTRILNFLHKFDNKRNS